MIYTILQNFEKVHISVPVCIDLSVAFDAVGHEIMLEVLGNILAWKHCIAVV